MSDELFPVIDSPSPRLAWLRRHNLTLVKKHETRYECVLDSENIGRGETADDACIDFCLKTKLPHYNHD